MSGLLRRKLLCFYCNRRSAQDRKTGIQQWQCEKCDAVNYLDENGEVADPPVQETNTSKRYAQPRPRSISPDANHLQRSLFCQRCIQNQHIVNQALAEYLPSQDDPRYLEFERRSFEYRKKMEADFPQVCEKCAPAVEDRIRSTGYAAKTDHLRRMMHRTRNGGMTHNCWSWKRVVAMLGAIGWSIGLLGQFLLNILGSFPMIEADEGLRDYDEPDSMTRCIVHGAFSLQSTYLCKGLTQPLLGYACASSLLCFWWNPRMQYKLAGGYGRIVSHIEYYKLQLMALVIRFISWKVMAKDSPVQIDPQAARALHGFSLVVGIILTILSFHTIRIDQQPLVSFQENYEPLVPVRSDQQAETANRHTQRALSPLSKRRLEPFPIEKLAPKPQQSAYQPLTPPSEEDAEDYTMEWSPQHNFRPASSYRIPQTKPVYDGPSPFHGTIPDAPISWAQRLRNPPKPPFQEALESKKENFFAKKNKHVAFDAASDVSSPAPSVAHDSMFDTDSPVKFAPPRFFAPIDRMETGLESLFGETFSLGKEQPLSGRSDQQASQATVSYPASRPFIRLMTAFVFGALCVAWDYASIIFPAYHDLARLMIIILAGLNAIYNLSLEIPRPDRSLGYIMLQMAELITAGLLAQHFFSSSHNRDLIATVGLWYLVAMTVQEVWNLVSSLAAPPAEAPVTVPELRQQAPPAPVEEVSAPENKAQLRNGHSSRLRAARTPKATASSTLATKAKSNTVELNQRTTRSRARNEVRRDSLGVDRLGSLSLGEW
ncbi:MAG: hypothetical protein Q9170_006120 [Blastenia crenularia]